MSSRKPQYITTAIDYPNAPPHMGHVLEKVLADVIARWFRLRGDDVRFQIGTDEHGIKIQQAAKAAGKDPAAFVGSNRQKFIDLYGRLNISYDEPFMHTSGNPQHAKVVQELWKRLRKARVFEKRDYTALYCSGCERFVTRKELVNGLCPDHGIPPEEVTEQNWFFTLSKDQDFLKTLLKSSYKIIPAFREPETMSLLDQGLEDVSFSRPTSSLAWGIPVPDDPDQTMYVWCDALTNYISGLNYFDDPQMAKKYWNDAEVTHVIGKDIARFHALIWPAMLHHAGVRTPDRLLIHGFLTSEGQKMSKSIGNVVVPQYVIEKYGVDAMRFYLSHEIPVGNDGDFSWKRFGELYDSKLRNQLGNLLNRVLILMKKNDEKLILNEFGNWNFVQAMFNHNYVTFTESTWNNYRFAMDSFELSKAVQSAFDLIDYANKFIDKEKPFSQNYNQLLHLQEIQIKKGALITSILAEILRHSALMLLPFMPETSIKIANQLSLSFTSQLSNRNFMLKNAESDWTLWAADKQWNMVGEPAILFAPVA